MHKMAFQLVKGPVHGLACSKLPSLAFDSMPPTHTSRSAQPLMCVGATDCPQSPCRTQVPPCSSPSQRACKWKHSAMDSPRIMIRAHAMHASGPQVKALMELLGMKVRPDEVEAMIADLDTDGSGQIDFNE